MTPHRAGTRELGRVAGKIIDFVDRRILIALQKDAAIPMARLAELAGLTATGCWRRIRRLEADGIILERVTHLSPEALGLSLTGFVTIRTGNHGTAWLRQFKEIVAAMPEVIELHRLTGKDDYLLKVVTADMAAFNRLYGLIADIPDIDDVSSAFSMERIKETSALPL